MQAGFILQPSYRVRRGVPVLQLFGRLESGEPFLIEEDRYRPYFFVRTSELEALERESEVEIGETELTNLAGEPVTRVAVSVPAGVPPIRDRLIAAGIGVYEADLRFPYRFLTDRGVRAGVAIEGEFEVQRDGLRVYSNPQLRPAECAPALRVVSLDIETTPDSSRILSFALAGDGIAEVHMVYDEHRFAAAPEVQLHAGEAALLVALARRLRELDIDVIVGWNVVGFDFRVIADRCSALGVSPDFGRVPGAIYLRQDPGYTRGWRAQIPGRMVLDGIPLVRDAIKLDDYRLETVARALLGRGKLLDSSAPNKANEILRLYEEDPRALAAYNLEDARLVAEILEQEGLLELTYERARLSGMQLDRVGASIASFDLLYLPELRRRGFVAPCVDRERKLEPVRGGAVLDSQPGLFRNVAVFDFKSLYPSLIRTFNLDPLAHSRGRGASEPITAPNGARFSRDEAILPSLLANFTERREAAKARGDRHADQAIKIMMNALFGVLGSASCRFFDPQVANAITSFGQQTLSWTRATFEEAGVEVIYGDTDSVFVRLATQEPGEAAHAEAEALRRQVEQTIRERVRSEYRVDPQLTLELEHVYDRFFMPRVRGGRAGSKKRYAGWDGGKLEIVGLEAVRRDWPSLAKRLQEGILELIFEDRDALPFVKQLVAELKAGELDRELVYVKRIRKGSLDRYTATTPPHVQAARKAGASSGDVVRYVVTTGGPEPLRDDALIPQPIDRRHYLEKVMRPIVDSILPEVGQSFDEALGEARQLSLL